MNNLSPPSEPDIKLASRIDVSEEDSHKLPSLPATLAPPSTLPPPPAPCRGLPLLPSTSLIELLMRIFINCAFSLARRKQSSRRDDVFEAVSHKSSMPRGGGGVVEVSVVSVVSSLPPP
jgi:hypothetical protein